MRLFIIFFNWSSCFSHSFFWFISFAGSLHNFLTLSIFSSGSLLVFLNPATGSMCLNLNWLLLHAFVHHFFNWSSCFSHSFFWFISFAGSLHNFLTLSIFSSGSLLVF